MINMTKGLSAGVSGLEILDLQMIPTFEPSVTIKTEWAAHRPYKRISCPLCHLKRCIHYIISCITAGRAHIIPQPYEGAPNKLAVQLSLTSTRTRRLENKCLVHRLGYIYNHGFRRAQEEG
jgi:hypothetical protein